MKKMINYNRAALLSCFLITVVSYAISVYSLSDASEAHNKESEESPFANSPQLHSDYYDLEYPYSNWNSWEHPSSTDDWHSSTSNYSSKGTYDFTEAPAHPMDEKHYNAFETRISNQNQETTNPIFSKTVETKANQSSNYFNVESKDQIQRNEQQSNKPASEPQISTHGKSEATLSSPSSVESLNNEIKEEKNSIKALSKDALFSETVKDYTQKKSLEYEIAQAEERIPVRPTPTTQTLVPVVARPAGSPSPTRTPIPQTAVNQTQQANVQSNQAIRDVSVNFNNVAMVEYIRFISKISNKNFVFDEADLQFNVTIVSEEPTSVENLMAALLQELRIRDLSLMEQGNNIIIHRNPRVRSPGHIVAEGLANPSKETELVTRVFRLNTLDPIKAGEIIRPLLSDDALVEVLRDSNNLVITDLVTNVDKIAQLIFSLDAPNSGMTIGQYVVRNAFVDSLAVLADRILQPIAQGNPFELVPHSATNSIFIVSNPFIVERALAILENLDNNEGRTKIFSLDALRFRGAAPGTPGGPGGAGGAGGIGTDGRQGFQGAPGTAGIPGTSGTGGFYEPGAGGFYGPGGVGPGGIGPGGAPGAPGLPGTGEAGGFFGPGTGPSGIGPGGAGFPGGSGVGLPGAGVPGVIPGSLGGTLGSTGTNVELRGGPAPFGGVLTDRNFPTPAEIGGMREFTPGVLYSAPRWMHELPAGHIERTLFFLYKLKYRRGDQIEIALRKIADSLQLAGMANADLIAAINSIQWLESTNSLIFTGTVLALERIKQLIQEIDLPLRQVFIEMLILEVSIADSLNYGVDWGSRFGGGDNAGAEAFLASPTSPLSTSLTSAEPIVQTASTITNPVATFNTPTISNLAQTQGFSLGVIGRHLTRNGTHFNTIGALVTAIHTDTKTNVLLNPKIITEDNHPAEVFVGSTTRYKTQSISNDFGTVITNNFQFLDVGTTLRVTPLIGNNDVITLDIVQEITSASSNANPPTNTAVVDINLVPILNKNRTVTKVHVPDGFFVVLSGMIQDTQTRTETRVPCLGGIPIIGAANKNKALQDNVNNLMIFIRPLIIDTDDELEYLTKRQQDCWIEKNKFRRKWNYEIDEALDFANIRPTDPDEIGCTIR